MVKLLFISTDTKSFYICNSLCFVPSLQTTNNMWQTWDHQKEKKYFVCLSIVCNYLLEAKPQFNFDLTSFLEDHPLLCENQYGKP